MSTHPTNPRREHASTYFVDRSNLDEMSRLTVQSQMVTAGMGGVLPEQPDPTSFQRVLDVACGTGGWLIEAAKTYPHMTRLVGVDVNRQMIEYAREQAKAEQLQDRVEFHVMDALLYLEFPKGYFDLVNMRFATSFMRTWNWPKLLDEMQRIAKPGGVIRFTEIESVASRCQAAIHMTEIVGDALFKSGHLFSEGETEGEVSRGTLGVASDLGRLLYQYGVQYVQLCPFHLEFAASTPAGHSFAKDLQLGFRTLVPFIRKWSRLPENYEELYQQMLRDMQQPDMLSSWNLITAWGYKNLDEEGY